MRSRPKVKRKANDYPNNKRGDQVGQGNDPVVIMPGVSWCPSCIEWEGRYICPQYKLGCVYKEAYVDYWRKYG